MQEKETWRAYLIDDKQVLHPESDQKLALTVSYAPCSLDTRPDGMQEKETWRAYLIDDKQVLLPESDQKLALTVSYAPCSLDT